MKLIVNKNDDFGHSRSNNAVKIMKLIVNKNDDFGHSRYNNAVKIIKLIVKKMMILDILVTIMQ